MLYRYLLNKRKSTTKGAGRVLLVADRPNWAYDSIARALVKFNDDPDLQFDIEYVKNGRRRLEDIHKSYDLIFFMGWQTISSVKSFKLEYSFIDSNRILTGIHSHHSWDKRESAPDSSISPPAELVDFLNKFNGVNAVSRRLYGLFLKAGLENIAYTPNGVDIDLFAPISFERKNDDLIVGFSGNNRHDWRKGINEFIKPATQTSGLTLKLAMPTPGHYVSLEDMPSFYKAIDVYVCASSSEGFSLSVLEAAASGCPIISTRVGGCEDLIIEGVNGFLVDRNVLSIQEKLIVLRDDARTFESMSHMSRKIVEQLWSWKIRVPMWVAFIKSRL